MPHSSVTKVRHESHSVECRSKSSWLIDCLPLTPILLWWFASIPGYFSPDSLDVFNQIRTGSWTSIHTTVYPLWFFVTSLNTRFISLVALSQTLALAAALIIFTRQLWPDPDRRFFRRAVLFLSSLNPAVGGLATMVWKDVPYSAGVLVVASGLLMYERKSKLLQAPLTVAAGCLTISTFRWNGPLTVSLLIFAVALLFKKRTAQIAVMSAALLLGVGTLLIPERLGVVEGPDWVLLNSRRLHDLSIALHNQTFVPSSDELDQLVHVLPLDSWQRGGVDCSSHDELMFSEISRLPANSRAKLSETNDIWWKLLRTQPEIIAKSRMCKFLPNLLPIQIGENRALALWSRPNNIPDLAQPQHIPTLSQGVNRVLDWSNTNGLLHWSFFRAPIWLLLNVCLILIARRRGVRILRPYVLIVSIALSVMLSAGLVAVAQDFRYSAGALILLQLSSLALIHDVYTQRRNKPLLHQREKCPE